MRLLLDTHIVIWLNGQPHRLTVGERSAMAEARQLAVSVATFWEIRLK